MNPADGAIILKSDEKGRVRTPPEQRDALLAEFDRCGMSGAAFARHCGIKYQTFVAWRRTRERRRSKAAVPSGVLNLAEVLLDRSPSKPADGLRIELPGGACLHVRDVESARLAAAVLNALNPKVPNGC